MRAALVLLMSTTPAYAADGNAHLAIPVLLVIALLILPIANRQRRR